MQWASLCSWITELWLAFWAGIRDQNGAERDSNKAGTTDSADADRRESFDNLLHCLKVLGACLDWR